MQAGVVLPRELHTGGHVGYAETAATMEGLLSIIPFQTVRDSS